MSTAPLRADSPAFKRVNRAMMLGGFSTFALLYCVQPLMPLLGQAFALTPAQSSWSLSISTATLALSLMFSSTVADRVGRKTLMTAAMATGALMTVLSALVDSFGQLLLVRALLGIALGGMPAVAMAYLSEEIEGPSLGLSMGLYIAGSAFGGMAGRLGTAVLSDVFSWRIALATMGVAGLCAAWEFWRNLPASRHGKRARSGLRALGQGVHSHLRDEGLRWLLCLAFLLMGCFVSVYNYLGYRLLGAPFTLSQSAAGAFSALYLLGIFSAVWAGRLADRIGRRNVLWSVILMMGGGLLLTLFNHVAWIVLGMSLLTFGFFAAHSVASSWVGRRARAPQALAAALYLFFYYLGSSVIGSLCGRLWSAAGWPGVVSGLSVLLVLALGIALRLRGVAPLPVALATANQGTA